MFIVKQLNYKMGVSPKKLIILVVFNLLLLGQSEGSGRDFHGYLPAEEHKTFDYQVFQNPQNFPLNGAYEECARNPMLPLLGKGANLLMLKLGVLGIIKAVMAFVFAGFLMKIPLFLLKLVFMKSFFLPFLAVPLLFQAFFNQMQPTNHSESEEKPGETSTEMPTIMAMSEMADMGRQFAGNLTSMAWQSVQMFAESGECAEKLSCVIGASGKDSSTRDVFKRILKYLHYSSTPPVQKKVESLRDAFNKGSKSSTCLNEDYKCQIPESLLQYGIEKLHIF